MKHSINGGTHCLAVLVLLLCSACAAEFTHDDLLTIDTHIDIPVNLADPVLDPGADPGVDGPMQVDLPKMRRGGLDAGFFIVYVGQGELTESGYQLAYEKAQKKFEAIERMLDRYPEEIGLARSPAELVALHGQGRLVAAIGVENAWSLGAELEHLQEFYDRGARYVSLTHVGHNQFASSSIPPADPADPERGLSEAGRRLVGELNRLGIMVDVSHASRATTLQSASLSRAPVIASHSGVKALWDHPRNLTDEEIRAIADGGGVIQLVAFDVYMRDVSAENAKAMKAIREELGLTGPDWYTKASEAQMHELRRRMAELDARWPRASVKTLVDHIDYVVGLVGVEHAGVVSDFGGGGGVKGWDSIDQTPVITAELLSRGYSEAEIRMIWGENLLRVWAEVEKLAEI